MADTNPTTTPRHTITLGRATAARVTAERTARRVVLELITASTGPTWQFVQTLNVATARELTVALLGMVDLAEGGAA